MSLIAKITLMAAAASVSAASGETHNTASFGEATMVCAEALEASSPEQVADQLEDSGWKLRRATQLGGIFAKTKHGVQIKFENVVGTYICTVLGNRDDSISSDVFQSEIEEHLKSEFAVIRKSESRDFTLILDDKVMSVVSTGTFETEFNAKVTSITAP